jgi:integrase
MRKGLLHLPFAEWPTEDQERWFAAIDNRDVFSDALGAHLSPASKDQYLYGWRRYLGFLSINRPETLERPLEERLAPSLVKQFVEHLRTTNTERSTAIQIDAMYKAARIMMPGLDLSWLRSIKARLYAFAPITRAHGPTFTSVEVLKRATSVMDSANINAGSENTSEALLQFRDGLLLAFLAFMPLRIKNLAAVEIGQSLTQTEDGFAVHFARSETKTSAEIYFEIPAQVVEYLVVYLESVRPSLDYQNRQNLWLGENGTAIRPNRIREIVAKRMTGFGARISPHDMRDAATTLWAIHKPHEIAVARDLLSHTNVRTTDRYYNRAKGIEASRSHASIISELRKRRS